MHTHTLPGTAASRLHSFQYQVALYKELKDSRDADPHIWGMTNMAFSRLFAIGDDVPDAQSIIITGESGAGKSFSTKKVLDFLACLSPKSGAGNTITTYWQYH